MEKTLEISYDIAAIPGMDNNPDIMAALDFRNEAMHFIEDALLKAMPQAEWVGAEIGMGEVNFGFEVLDFDQAEAIIRAAIKGTPYENAREFERREFDIEDYE
jgi:hypothetical protein